jgi:hypothetical protein
VERVMLAAGLLLLPFSAGIVRAPAAAAAFAGDNGPIAFVSTRLSEGSFGGIFEVNSQASGLGNANGDQAATTGLTNGDNGAGTDAEPFFSPSGGTVFFSSNRDANGVWVIYDISTTAPEPPGSPTELSQISGNESNDDYAPSVASDGRTLVFNRNDVSLDTLDADAPNPASTVCTLYTPSAGLAGVSNGRASRALFNPQNPTELLYVGADNQLHLVTGLPAPSATAPTNPCGAVAGQKGVTDTDLSAEATDSVTGSADATGSYQDENPDWSPDGTKIIFDSTRGGTNHTLWQMTNITSGTLTVTPLWPSQIGSGTALKSTTEPVYSPDGTAVAFVEPGQGQNTWTGDIVPMGQGLSSAEDVSLSTEGNGIVNDQPDWGPAEPSQGTPEVSQAIFLPGLALIIGGLGLAYQRRRQVALLRRSHARVTGRS